MIRRVWPEVCFALVIAVITGLDCKHWLIAVAVATGVLLWNVGNFFIDRSRKASEMARLRSESALLWSWMHQETTLRNRIRELVGQLMSMGEDYIPVDGLEDWRNALNAAIAALDGHEYQSSG